MTRFIVILAVLQWSGTQCTISPRSACIGRLGGRGALPCPRPQGAQPSVRAGAASGKPDNKAGIGYLTTKVPSQQEGSLGLGHQGGTQRRQDLIWALRGRTQMGKEGGRAWPGSKWLSEQKPEGGKL